VLDVRDKWRGGSSVLIPVKGERTAYAVLKLLNHEIGGHARQSMNGVKLFGLGGGQLKFDDETLYEGLAKRNDVLFQRQVLGEKDAAPYHNWSYAVRAAEQGGSYYEVLTEQVEQELHEMLKIHPDKPLPPRDQIDPKLLDDAIDNAMGTTYRVMRGHIDMSNPEKYAMAKDLSYLLGFMRDRELRQAGYAHVNEAAVIAEGGLLMLAEFDLKPEQLPVPYLVEYEGKKVDLGYKYWLEVLKPEYLAKREQPPA
jgi:hypothetical protein